MPTAKETISKILTERLTEFGDMEIPDTEEKIQLGLDDGSNWVIELEGGKPKVAEGEADNALISVIFSEGAVPIFMEQESQGGGASLGDASQMTQMLGKAKEIRSGIDGTIKIVLTRDDGDSESMTIGFCSLNKQSPTTTITMPEPLMKELQSQGSAAQSRMMQAFMGGEVKIEGDMALLMTMQSVLGVSF